jgi:hypothetical protein
MTFTWPGDCFRPNQLAGMWELLPQGERNVDTAGSTWTPDTIDAKIKTIKMIAGHIINEGFD